MSGLVQRYFSPVLMVVGLLFALVLPGLTDPTNMLLLCQVCIYAAFALSLFVLLGDGGVVSFGHAAFLGAGAYTVGVATVVYEWPLWVAWVMSPIVAAVLAVVIGWFSVRLTALYFAMLTLAFAQFLWAITLRVDFFGGEEGLIGVPTGPIGLDPVRFYYAGLIVLLVVLAVLWVVRRSPFGLALRATRENSVRSEFSGMRVSSVRLIGFVIAGMLAGLAGAMLAVSNGVVSPEVGYFDQSETAILIILIGGMRSIWGPILGAVVLVYGEHYVGIAFDAWEIALGVVIILIVLFVPGGITGAIGDLADRLPSGSERRKEGEPVADHE